MKVYCYNDLDGEHKLTELEILKAYYPYWQRKMRKVDKQEQINPRACIEDWVVVHWAWEV